MNARGWVCGTAPLLLAACAALPPPAPPPPLPHGRHGHCVVPVAGGLLSVGGFSAGPAGADRGTAETWWLGPGATQWQRRADQPTGRAFFAAVEWNGAVFALGDGVDRYDVQEDRWTPLSQPGVLPVSHLAAAALDGTAVVLGGFPLERSGCHAVDLRTGAVRPLPPPPGFAPGDHLHVMHRLGDGVRVIGGLDGATFTPQSTHHIWDGAGWRAGAPPPLPLWAKFAVHGVVDGVLVIAAENGACRYDAGRDQWLPCPPPPQVLAMPATVAWGGLLVGLGGLDLAGGHGTVLVFDPPAGRWR